MPLVACGLRVPLTAGGPVDATGCVRPAGLPAVGNRRALSAGATGNWSTGSCHGLPSPADDHIPVGTPPAEGGTLTAAADPHRLPAAGTNGRLRLRPRPALTRHSHRPPAGTIRRRSDCEARAPPLGRHSAGPPLRHAATPPAATQPAAVPLGRRAAVPLGRHSAGPPLRRAVTSPGAGPPHGHAAGTAVGDGVEPTVQQLTTSGRAKSPRCQRVHSSETVVPLAPGPVLRRRRRMVLLPSVGSARRS
ncbi:hypothetical protein FHR81_003309 [Actinoalloteichus hoggarensis]|uniref:Uncharacterized protein n=1 Tax=Actinoalloteichus hoggarensis TaxID=1470176 RepID=A0A221W7D7_9PSEU|nr:hypothetical protein AHOG_20235 [Actinoalloteichus hoggarensis]MBB5922257.1 hypothetical protein [Actinoalloteichus hoggarensis]